MFALSGTLDRLHLGDLLEWLHMTRNTGRLLLEAGAVTRAFDIVQGKVAFASSSRAAERLASWLLRKGLVPRATLLRTLAISQTKGEAFTVVLEREAKVPHADLVEAGRALATALVSRLLREEVVLFQFDPTWPVTQRLHVHLDLECSKLIMQAAYKADTLPPVEGAAPEAPTTLDPKTIENLFWRIAQSLDGELVDAAELAASHTTMLAVGELLHRWVTQGPPLLPLGPADVARVQKRLDAHAEVPIEDSPTLYWDLVSLVNGLDSPGFSRAAGAHDAWVMAGDDAPLLVRLILENSRWRREQREGSDEALRRSALARIAAARCLADAFRLSEDTATTASVLPIVLLELVVTALTSAPLASPAMQRTALNQLLPLVGRAAAVAAGLPEVLEAALTGRPEGHCGARVAMLAAIAAGEQDVAAPKLLEVDSGDAALAGALAAARQAAQRVAAKN